MTTPIRNENYIMTAGELRLQVAAFLSAFALRAFKITRLNPLTAGLAAQSLSQIMRIVTQLFPKPPNEMVKFLVCGGILCGSYKVLSRVDQRIQAISFLLFLIGDVKVIGFKNVWNELKK
jgi:hypothetical protein